MKHNLAVVFPGIGYTCAKPLLYYSASLASELGYQIISLDYGQDIHTFKGRNSRDLESIADLALERVLPVLSEINFELYDTIVFISKSIGTVISCKAGELFCPNYPLRHCLFTPIPATLPYLRKINGIFFSGTEDPYISKDLIIKASKEHPDKVGEIFEGCNHSLEQKGNTLNNLQNIEKVLHKLEKFL